MNARNISVALTALVLALSAAYGGWRIYLAKSDLVTLDVRRMDVRAVVKKIEAQTRETICVGREVQGEVTLKVRRMPLEQVLGMVADQTFSRSSTLYPLYSSPQSLTWLKKSLRGEADPMEHGWTNLVARAGGRGGVPSGPAGRGMMGGGPMAMGPGGGPAPEARPSAARISLHISGKDLPFALLAFNRFAQTRIVPEDGTSGIVFLTVKNATAPAAVASLAKAVKREAARIYALENVFRPGGPGPFAMRGGAAGGRRGPAGEQSEEDRETLRREREALETELKQTLPVEEQRRLEQAQREREQQFAELQALTPEQRRDRMAQTGGARMSQMNRDRVMNSTPEQRAQMNQRRAQMRPDGPPRP